jgi:putative glutamine amidotransferase
MRPRVGLICDRRMVETQYAHLVLEPYVTAVREGADAAPLLLPVLDPPLDHDDILGAVDGLLFPGSPSNVAPHFYGGAPAREPRCEDIHRDRLALPLLQTAAARGVPVLAICRGVQELNVALGGTLFQHIQDVPGRINHRESTTAPLAVQYGPAHDITLVEGGLLANLAGARRFTVNSLHGQGIDRLAPSLRIEATAPDGQIEAVSAIAPKGFLLGVQWHPEWCWSQHVLSRAIWSAFAVAIRAALH